MQRVALILVLVVAALAVWFFAFGEDEPPPPKDEPAARDISIRLSPIDFNELEQAPADTSPELATKGEKPAEEEPAAAPQVLGDLTLTGRVLDDRRRPVVGATLSAGATYDAGQHLVRGTTDAEGRYRLFGFVRPDEYGRIIVRAAAPTGAGQAQVGLSSEIGDEAPLPDIVLGPAHDLEVLVQGDDGAPAAGARVLLEATVFWTTVVVAEAETDAQGKYTFTQLPTGAYRVLASVPGHGRANAPTALPQRAPATLVLALGAERELVAIVTDKDTGEPIEGARVMVDEVLQRNGRPGAIAPWVPATEDLVTDAEGRVRIPGLGLEDAVQVGAEAAGYPARGSMRMIRSIPQTDTEARVALQKLRQLRFPLAADNPHAPPEGTLLEVKGTRGAINHGLPATLRIEDGHVVAEGCSPDVFHATAVAPDGSYARLFAKREGVYERDIVFLRPKKVVVIVKNTDGTPAEGTYVSARNQGNNVIVDPTKLGEEGRLELDVRYEHLIDFYASINGSSHGGRRIGSLHLGQQEGGTIEATMPSGREVELSITIDGEARLPSSYGIGSGMTGVTAKREDPERGLLWFDLATDGQGPAKLPFRAAGFLQTTLDIPAGKAGETTKVSVALERGGHVLLRIKLPSDGRSNVQVHKPGETARGFRVYGGGVTSVDLGMEDGWSLRRIGPYAAGSYQASDGGTQAKTEVFEVKTGETTTVSLDLSSVGFVKGRVEVPDGFKPWGARVQIKREGKPAAGIFARGQGVGVRQDGTFQLRVPGNQPVKITVSHPKLVPAAEGGTVEVTEARDGVVLKLVPGAKATFKLDPPAPEVRAARGQSPVNVLLYEKEPSGIADKTINAKLADGVYTVEGFPPGTYHVVVDVRQRAPVLLGKMTLGASTDLGTIATKAGATVRIKLLVPEGQNAPRIFASARPTEGPMYVRYTNSRGETEVLLTGLGAGNLQLMARTMQGIGSPGGSGRGTIDETIECSGEGEIVWELDLR